MPETNGNLLKLIDELGKSFSNLQHFLEQNDQRLQSAIEDHEKRIRELETLATKEVAKEAAFQVIKRETKKKEIRRNDMALELFKTFLTVVTTIIAIYLSWKSGIIPL